MSLVERLNKSISHPPSLIQVAIKGIWEDTWDIPFQNRMPSIATIGQYLEKGTEGLAFEVFFRTDDGYNIILGTRFTEQLITTAPKEFIITSFQSIWSVNPPAFASMISDLSEKLTGDTKALFEIAPTGVELGVVNWWKSMGSIEVWRNAQEKTISRETLKKQLEGHTHLLKNNNNYVALELNYRVTPHYWIGIQVSDKQARRWILNENRLENLLEELLDISVL
jgi:hypothetical protein